MGKSPDRGSSSVDNLLSERTQFEDWLARLAASNAPDAVRRRVQADYEARLAKVMESLREHADAIAADLDRLRKSCGDLERREGESLETIAEAELRHSVGEYTDGKWTDISRAQNASLEGVRKELARVRHEIERLSEVQSSIEGGPETESATGEGTLAKADEEEAEDQLLKADAETPAPEAVPAAKHASPKPGTSDDELDFLKSVTVEQASSLSPQNAVEHKSSSSAEPSPPAPAPASPAPAVEGSRPSNQAVATATAPQARPPASPSGTVKTLKCGECGTLNRPTEWYCERCGAELAAL